MSERDPLDVVIGAEIRRRRLVVGLSMEKVATAIGLTYQQVQKYEMGANRVSVSMLYQIADALRCNVGDLLADVDAARSGASASVPLPTLPVQWLATRLMALPEGVRASAVESCSSVLTTVEHVRRTQREAA